MRVSSLRWLCLLAAVAGGAWCALRGADAARVGVCAACGALWFWLSRRKVRSLDRDSLGLPPRR